MKIASLRECVDPWHRLALQALERAKRDAKRGDLGALAWLIFIGKDWADALAPGASEQILDFAAQQIEKADKEELKTTWKLY
jgi:hypothetical protein